MVVQQTYPVIMLSEGPWVVWVPGLLQLAPGPEGMGATVLTTACC